MAHSLGARPLDPRNIIPIVIRHSDQPIWVRVVTSPQAGQHITETMTEAQVEELRSKARWWDKLRGELAKKS